MATLTPGIAPLQCGAIKIEAAKCRAEFREGKKRGPDIVDIAGQRTLFGIERAPGSRFCLEEKDGPAVARKRCRRNHSVGARAHDNGVYHAVACYSAGFSTSLTTVSGRSLKSVLLVG